MVLLFENGFSGWGQFLQSFCRSTCEYVISLVASPLVIWQIHLCSCKSFAKIVPIQKNYILITQLFQTNFSSVSVQSQKYYKYLDKTQIQINYSQKRSHFIVICLALFFRIGHDLRTRRWIETEFPFHFWSSIRILSIYSIHWTYLVYFTDPGHLLNT